MFCRVKGEFITTVQQRDSACDHIRDWVLGTPEVDFYLKTHDHARVELIHLSVFCSICCRVLGFLWVCTPMDRTMSRLASSIHFQLPARMENGLLFKVWITIIWHQILDNSILSAEILLCSRSLNRRFFPEEVGCNSSRTEWGEITSIFLSSIIFTFFLIGSALLHQFKQWHIVNLVWGLATFYGFFLSFFFVFVGYNYALESKTMPYKSELLVLLLSAKGVVKKNKSKEK